MEETTFQSIKTKCEIALVEYYPAGVPEPATARLTEELEHLQNSTPEILDDFLLYSELADTAKRGGFEICLEGTTIGSIIVFLLGNRRINPLPAHYYCRKCGYFEMTEEVTFGLDLPEKVCPDCGTQLILDGFSLPIESVWKSSPVFEYRIPDAFQPFAKQVVRRHYDISRYCLDLYNPQQIRHEWMPPKYEWSGFAILPAGMHEMDVWDLLDRTEDGRYCIDGWDHSDFFDRGIKCIPFHSSYLLNYLYELQSMTGAFSSDLHPQEIQKSKWLWRELLNTHALLSEERDVLRWQRPTSFKGAVDCICGSHNTYVLHDDEDFPYSNVAILKRLTDTEGFKKYPFFCREDLFELLLKEGYERKDSFEISEAIRKGKARTSFYWDEKLSVFCLPKGLETTACQVGYLFPRAHVAQQTMQLLLLLLYQAMYNDEYREIVFKDR